MGHPQPPTPIYCDNECAVGLANDVLTPKMSRQAGTVSDFSHPWTSERCRFLDEVFACSSTSSPCSVSRLRSRRLSR
jgi:hypothetical protein